MKLNAAFIAILIFLASFSIFINLTQEATASPRYTIDSFGGGVSTGLPTTGYYDCIGVGNVNGDSYMDFASGGDSFDGGSSTQGLYYYTSNGAGSWTQTTITATNSFAGIQIADCDSDGFEEVYACYQEGSGSGVGAWEWTGSAFSGTGITSPLTSGGVNFINVENITGGPGLDMVVATHNGIKYYEGNGSSPIAWTEYSTGLTSSSQFTQSAIADFNNDGRLDIVAGQYGNGLHFYTQDSGGTSWTDRSTTLPIVEQSGRILGVTAGDVNKDGNADIIYNRRTGPTGLFLLLGNGGGVTGSDFKWTYLNNSWVSRPGGTFYQLNLGDVDNDGDLDLLAPKEQYGLYLFLGNGSSSPGLNFTWTDVSGKGLPTTMQFFGSNFLDYDNDGDLDIAACTWGDGIRVYQNNLTLPDVPIARAGNDQIVFLGNSVNLNGKGSYDPQDCPGGDSTGAILTYDWNITGQPIGSSLTDLNLTPSDSSAEPSFIPTHTGDHFLSLRVRDSESHWSIVEDTIRITVIASNSKPVANAGADQQVETGATITLDGSGSYDNEDTIYLLTFDWNVSGSNPEVVSLDDETSIQPTFTAPGTTGIYNFSLIIQDSLGAWSLEDDVEVTIVLPPNLKPYAIAGDDTTVYSNESIDLNGSLSYDNDGTILSWDWNCTSHPYLIIQNENTSTPSFTPDRSGKYIFTLRVEDDRGRWSSEDSVIITVIEHNLPPIADAGSDFTAYLNMTTHLNGTLSYDSDGSIITWNWTCTNDPLLSIVDQNSSTPSFKPLEVTTYSFTLVVMDNLNIWSGIDHVNISVVELPTNSLPIASAGEDFTVKVNTTVTLDGSESVDEDGSIVTWAWSSTSHPTLIFNNKNSSQPTFYAVVDGKYTITLRVKDESGAWSTEDVIVVTVLPDEPIQQNHTTNNPPTVELTSPVEAKTFSGILMINWSASDPDGDTLTFTIELLEEDGSYLTTLVENHGSTIRSLPWNTKTVADGSYIIRIIVTDGTDTGDDTSQVVRINNHKAETNKENDTTSVTSSSWFFILILIIVVVVILLIIFLIMRSKKKEELDDDIEYEEDDYEDEYEDSNYYYNQCQEQKLDDIDADNQNPESEDVEQNLSEDDPGDYVEPMVYDYNEEKAMEQLAEESFTESEPDTEETDSELDEE